MVGDLAAGVLAARTRTRIFAFLIDARHILGAFRTDHTLGTTVGRCADEGGQARAHGVLIQLATLAVQAARRRLAGIYVRRFLN